MSPTSSSATTPCRSWPTGSSYVVDVEPTGATCREPVDEGAAGWAVVVGPVGVAEVDLQDRVVGAGDEAGDRGADPQLDRLALVGGPVLDPGPGPDAVADLDARRVRVAVGAGPGRPVQLGVEMLPHGAPRAFEGGVRQG